jgi:translation initiation factor IF-2
MAEQTARKIKVYKLATELNLSSDTLIEFLNRKGYEVKNHMSSVTPDMMSAILSHFKKEKDVAERHQRKLRDFRSSRKKEGPEKVEKKERVEEEAEAEKQPVPAESPVPAREEEKKKIEEPRGEVVEEKKAKEEPVEPAVAAKAAEKAEPNRRAREEGRRILLWQRLLPGEPRG